MSVRSSMADLISRVRLLISDSVPQAPATSFFTDQQIQDELDRNRIVARFAPLRPEPQFAPGGIVHYHDYFSDFGDWESNAILYDNAFNVIDLAPPDGNGTLVSSDFITGHWTFTDNPNSVPIKNPFGQPPLVRLTGNTYDVFASAASLLEFEAATVSLQFDFTTNQQMFKRSQQAPALLKLAEFYLERARPVYGRGYRSDQADATWLPANQWFGSGATY